MCDLTDHPFAVFMAGESYEPTEIPRWLAWSARVEKILGHSLDGDQASDGYSLDDAYAAWKRGTTAADYAREIQNRR